MTDKNNIIAHLLKIFLCMSAVTAVSAVPARAQYTPGLISYTGDGQPVNPADTVLSIAADSTAMAALAEVLPADTVVEQRFVTKPLSPFVFMPVVYTKFKLREPRKPFTPDFSGDSVMHKFEEEIAAMRNEQEIIERLWFARPDLVPYNIETMHRAPKQYIAKVDPKQHTISIEEVLPETPKEMEVNIRKRHWLKTFDASLHFSQAFISPNWYQGGNNNLNMLVNVYYNVKLNPAFHKNLLFESTFQYKLGLNNAPDDSLRNYSISEDLLQINTTFGVKAARRWYYSLTAQFKTQVLNSYVKNERRLSSAFLSPAEFNGGVGMTYNYANKKKTFTFDASIAPISYNMKICVKDNAKLSHEAFNVPPEKKYSVKYGSTAETKLMWQICSNIQFRSRLFVFSDYSYIQGDWENTLAMDINRYLSTQLYAHLRYDSTTPRSEDPSWHKLQVKEILSFGVTYHFSSL